MTEDRELEQYRSLMQPPKTFMDGFTLKSVIGCVFIGLVMMPASMYLSLLMGADLGGAARWVTVILFVELARRSFTTLKTPEIFILFYMAGAALASPFSGLLWNQFYVNSDAARAMNVADHIPSWIAPKSDVIALRTFFHPAWFAPILMVVLGQLLSRIDNFGLGYVLFRITSDVEKLPFPMAPVGAMGVTALAENSSGQTSWRWRVFSIGGMLGLLFGVLFVGIPALSGAILHRPIQIIPITYYDLTTHTENILPATPVAVSFDIGNLLIGMVLPFFAVLGSFLGMILTWIVNPILHATGQLPSWQPGMNAVDTSFNTYTDVYMSVGIGLSFAIALIGFFHAFRSLRKKRTAVVIDPQVLGKTEAASRKTEDGSQKAEDGSSESGDSRTAMDRLLHPPAGRGDFPLWVGIAIYLFSTGAYIAICRYLIPTFPPWILLAYGFVYTPVMSYVAARMEGVAGQWVEIPMVREATFILSHRLGGYSGVDIWFAPIPIHNYAGTVVAFRTQELTGTKFTSLVKAEMVMFPVVMISSILFSQYLWRIARIPSATYPYANQYWELSARTAALTQSSTLDANSPYYAALKWKYILGSGGVGVLLYSVLSSCGAPVMLCYGLVRGLGTGLSAGILPQMLGALLSRYYFERKFDLKWREYAPVLLAGFSCGMGLISKAVFQLPY